MFSISRLLGREDAFFDLLEGSASEARESVRLALALLKSPERGAAAAPST